MSKIVKCRCGAPEYEGKMTWLNGKVMCRSCYKHRYAEQYGKVYPYSDKNYTKEEAEALRDWEGQV